MGVGLNFLARVQPAWFLAAAAFFLPIKPAPVNVFLLLALVFIYIKPNSWRLLVQATEQTSTLLLIALVVFLLATFFYSASDPGSYGDFLSKYGRFLLIPLLVPAFQTTQDRWLVGQAFLASMAITLILSYLVFFQVDLTAIGVVSDGEYATPANPTVFKKHITHNFFMAIALYFWLLALGKAVSLARQGSPKAILWGLIYAGLVIAAFVNLFAMVDGRTGWVVFAVVPLALGIQRFGFKGLAFGGVAALLIAAAAYFAVENVQQRINKGVQEVSDFQTGVDQKSSVGERMMLQISGWHAFTDAPILGHGIGGVKNAVAPYTTQFDAEPFQNPHNQYLLLLIQGGVLGLGLYMAFIVSAVLRTYRTTWGATYLAPVLLMFVVGNLLNSFHYDFSESVAFILLISALSWPRNHV